MTHQSKIVGWTPARIKRTRMFAVAVAVAAVAVGWAMFLPWVGLTISTLEPTCSSTANAGSVQMRSTSGEVVSVQATGCVSAYDSVQSVGVGDVSPYISQPQGSLSQSGVVSQPQPTQMGAPGSMTAGTPFGAPTPDVKYGIPAQTFWAVLVAALVVVSLLVRNAFGFVPALLLVKFSYGAFVSHRAALTWGMEGFGEEMVGVAAHQWSFFALIGLSAASAWLILKGNHEQRKLDGKPHPAVAALNFVASFMLRIDTDKLRGAVEKAATAGAPKKA